MSARKKTGQGELSLWSLILRLARKYCNSWTKRNDLWCSQEIMWSGKWCPEVTDNLIWYIDFDKKKISICPSLNLHSQKWIVICVEELQSIECTSLKIGRETFALHETKNNRIFCLVYSMSANESGYLQSTQRVRSYAWGLSLVSEKRTNYFIFLLKWWLSLTGAEHH